MNNPPPLNISKRRILAVVMILFYIAVFNLAYKFVVCPVYNYWGFSYNPPPVIYIIISLIVGIVPSFWMPIEFNRPSLLLFYIQYFVLYIPSIFVLYHVSRPIIAPQEVLSLVLLMFAGISIMQSSYLFKTFRFKRVKIKYFWSIFLLSMLLLLVYVLVVLGGNFRLASLADIYEVRSAMNEIVSASGSRFGYYAQSWLAGFYFPFCFAVCVFSRRWWGIVLVAVGYLMLFGIGGSKTTLFSLVYISFVYIWLAKFRNHVVSAFACGLAFLLAMPALFVALCPPVISKWYVAVLHFRTFTVPSLLIAQYYEFFKDNPFTYLSHVSGISFFVEYPYDRAYSLIIGDHFYGGGMNANAGLWAGDGLAGFGLQGIIFMSIICAVMFYLLDCVASPYDPCFVAVAITFSATSFMNAPLSTTILSGGLAFVMVSLFILPDVDFIGSG